MSINQLASHKTGGCDMHGKEAIEIKSSRLGDMKTFGSRPCRRELGLTQNKNQRINKLGQTEYGVGNRIEYWSIG